MIRFVIDEPAFRRLVAGQPLTVEGVEITISPMIGWVRLTRAILDAVAPAARDATAPLPEARQGGPPDPPQAREFLPRSGRR
jgi:hypothetical protein